MTSLRQHCLNLLSREMQANTGWVRIHAADALLDQQQTAIVASAFVREAEDSMGRFRIGGWRVIARAASTDSARRDFIERIRNVILDSVAPDRLQAVESVCKLNAANPVDREVVQQWFESADVSVAAFPAWFLVLSSPALQRAVAEEQLARLLDSPNAIARLRAAYAVGRLAQISSTTWKRLYQQLAVAPVDSLERVLMINAALAHTKDEIIIARLRSWLIPHTTQGKPEEQLNAAAALGRFGKPDDLEILLPLFDHPEAGVRIGAAGGALCLLRS